MREVAEKPMKNPALGRAGRHEEGGRVPRQGRHFLDGTLDRMEGASLRGPETLPPWNLGLKGSDTSWYHSRGAEALTALL